jgi:hypothetical protein
MINDIQVVNSADDVALKSTPAAVPSPPTALVNRVEYMRMKARAPRPDGDVLYALVMYGEARTVIAVGKVCVCVSARTRHDYSDGQLAAASSRHVGKCRYNQMYGIFVFIRLGVKCAECTNVYQFDGDRQRCTGRGGDR